MTLFGPVFRHDLVRVARRQPLALWRALYALGLLIALALVYVNTMPPDVWFGGYVRPGAEAQFASSFLTVFTLAQFAAVILLTPAAAANSLAEEKTHNTLIFLFTTQLTSREIVFGKLATRLLQVGSLVLTGLPVLAILQFLGGVDLPKVIASFVAVGITAMSLAAVGLACAVFTRKPQNAPWRAYQIVLAYAALSSIIIWAYELPWGSTAAGWTFATPVATGTVSVTGAMVRLFVPPQPWDSALLEPLNYANPYYAFRRIWLVEQSGGDVNAELFWTGGIYVAVHLAIAALFTGLSVWRLRAAAAKLLGGGGLTEKKKVILKPAPHPPINNRPVLWKELYCESKPRQRWLALLFSRWFFVASFLPAWIIIVLLLDNSFSKLASYTLMAVRYGGTLVACGLIVRVGLQAARSIGAERDRETFDSLMTTELEPREVVSGKWWGALLSGRMVMLWLLVHWGLGALALAVSVWAIPLLICATTAFAAFAVSLGMWCAARYRRTRTAVTAALLILAFGTTLAPWAFGKLAGAVLDAGPTRPMAFRWGPPHTPWPERVAAGLSPPQALAASVLRSSYFWSSYNYYDGWDDEAAPETLFALAFGIIVYTALAVVLAARAQRTFRESLPGHWLRRKANLVSSQNGTLRPEPVRTE